MKKRMIFILLIFTTIYCWGDEKFVKKADYLLVQEKNKHIEPNPFDFKIKRTES